MKHKAKSIRAFIGAKDFNLSRKFYLDLGFEEIILFSTMSYFKSENLGFYLQDAYAEDWINNTMLFMEVDDVQRFWDELVSLQLPSKYDTVKLIPIREENWGRECFLHDPSGILWHFGEFYK